MASSDCEAAPSESEIGRIIFFDEEQERNEARQTNWGGLAQ